MSGSCKLLRAIRLGVLFAITMATPAAGQVKKETKRFTGVCLAAGGDAKIEGATVHLLLKRTGSLDIVAKAKAATDGRFEIVHPVEIWDHDRASFMLLATSDGFASRFTYNPSQTDAITIDLQPAKVLSGTVTDLNGRAVPGAVVHLGQNRITGIHDAVTDAEGDFRIDDLPGIGSFEANEPFANRLIASHPQLGFTAKKIDSLRDKVQLSFDSPLPKSFGNQIRRTGLGEHEFPGGVKLKVTSRPYHGPNMMTEGVLRWPAKDGLPSMQHKFHIASDSFGNRSRWTMLWHKDRCQLWMASSMNDNPWIRVLDFSDPTSIATFYRVQTPSRKPGEIPKTFASEIQDARVAGVTGKADDPSLPKEALRTLNQVFPSLPKVDKNHQLSCAKVLQEAVIDTEFVVKGTVKNWNGAPMSRVTVRAKHQSNGAEFTRTGTNRDGTYELKFRLPLSEISNFPSIVVYPTLANHFERELGDVGPFTIAVRGDRDGHLVPGAPKIAHFQLLPSATLEGQFESAKQGTLIYRWNSKDGRDTEIQTQIDSRGRYRSANLPTTPHCKVHVRLNDANDKLIASGKVSLTPKRMTLQQVADGELVARELDTVPVEVVIVRNQTTMASPDNELEFANLVHKWVESSQGNSTLPVANFNKNVWEDVTTGYNHVRLKFREPRSMVVQTDDGQESRLITEVAFPMYDMKPGSIFAKSVGSENTLVLDDQLIEPTIQIIGHPAMSCFVSKWYEPYIHAWNHPPPKATDRVAKIGINPEGILTLDKKPLPRDINELGGVLRTAGFDRRDSLAVITAEPTTPYGKLHWVMWKLGQLGWKTNVVLRVSRK